MYGCRTEPMVVLAPSPPPFVSLSPRSSSPQNLLVKSTKPLPKDYNGHRRALLLLASSSLLLGLVPSSRIARAQEIYELEEDERRVVRIFQVRLTASLRFFFKIV